MVLIRMTNMLVSLWGIFSLKTKDITDHSLLEGLLWKFPRGIKLGCSNSRQCTDSVLLIVCHPTNPLFIITLRREMFFEGRGREVSWDLVIATIIYLQ